MSNYYTLDSPYEISINIRHVPSNVHNNSEFMASEEVVKQLMEIIKNALPDLFKEEAEE